MKMVPLWSRFRVLKTCRVLRHICQSQVLLSWWVCEWSSYDYEMRSIKYRKTWSWNLDSLNDLSLQFGHFSSSSRKITASFYKIVCNALILMASFWWFRLIIEKGVSRAYWIWTGRNLGRATEWRNDLFLISCNLSTNAYE